MGGGGLYDTRIPYASGLYVPSNILLIMIFFFPEMCFLESLSSIDEPEHDETVCPGTGPYGAAEYLASEVLTWIADMQCTEVRSGKQESLINTEPRYGLFKAQDVSVSPESFILPENCIFSAQWWVSAQLFNTVCSGSAAMTT